jgi:hypothetical protein
MGRVQLTVGTRYRWGGRMYVVRQLVREGGLLVEDQTGGGQAVVARDDLQAAWGAGGLTFAGAGLWTGSAPDRSRATAATIADVHLLPEAQRAEAWRWYALIQPLLAVPARVSSFDAPRRTPWIIP